MSTQEQKCLGYVKAVRQYVSKLARQKGQATALVTVDGDDRTNPVVVTLRSSELLCRDLVDGLSKILKDYDVCDRTVRLKLELVEADAESITRQLNRSDFRRKLELLLSRFGSYPGDFWLDDGKNLGDTFVFILSPPQILDGGIINELLNFSTEHPVDGFSVYYDVHAVSGDLMQQA